ncbi:unnamed protein product [Parajaminaea phylloscopi]
MKYLSVISLVAMMIALSGVVVADPPVIGNCYGHYDGCSTGAGASDVKGDPSRTTPIGCAAFRNRSGSTILACTCNDPKNCSKCDSIGSGACGSTGNPVDVYRVLAPVSPRSRLQHSTTPDSCPSGSHSVDSPELRRRNHAADGPLFGTARRQRQGNTITPRFEVLTQDLKTDKSNVCSSKAVSSLAKKALPSLKMSLHSGPALHRLFVFRFRQPQLPRPVQLPPSRQIQTTGAVSRHRHSVLCGPMAPSF